mgnify:CR=1 FL=1
MTKFYLETTGILVEFDPKHLHMTTYVRNEVEQILIMRNIDTLRREYKELLSSGYKKCDSFKVIDTDPISATPLEQEIELQSEIEAIHQAEIEALEREEFFTAKPDDWAY